MSTSGPFQPPTAPGWTTPPRPPQPDYWGHEVGEDVDHQLDANGHIRTEHEVLAHLLGPPQVITPRSRAQTIAIRLLVTLVVLAVLGAAAWYLITQQHILD